MDTNVESTIPPETEQNQAMQIIDRRSKVDDVSKFVYSERLRKGGVSENLTRFGAFLGEYSAVDTDELTVHLADGEVGNGEVVDGELGVSLPEHKSLVAEMQKIGKMKGMELSEQEASDMGYANALSTTLHEGSHYMLDSKPGSKFHQKLEELSGVADPGARRSTLVDEGLAYGLQGIDAPTVKIGESEISFAPRIEDKDSEEEKARKKLGEIIRPRLQSYLEEGKKIDDEFIKFIAESLV